MACPQFWDIMLFAYAITSSMQESPIRYATIRLLATGILYRTGRLALAAITFCLLSCLGTDLGFANFNDILVELDEQEN
jgi:hypothetical protein